MDDQVEEMKAAQDAVARWFISNIGEALPTYNEATRLEICELMEVAIFSEMKISDTAASISGNKEKLETVCLLLYTYSLLMFDSLHSAADSLFSTADLERIQASQLEIFVRKNADYGSSFEIFGLIGVMIRMVDKINRAMVLLDKPEHSVDESLSDTLGDLNNYATIALMLTLRMPSTP